MTARPPRRSLAEAFQPGTPGRERAESLNGLLPPRPVEERPAGSPVSAPESALALLPDTSGQDSDNSRRQRGVTGSSRRLKRPDTSAAESDLALVRNVAVYVPLDLLTRLRQTSRSRELTYAELVVEAAEAHLDEMATAFVQGQGHSTRSGMPVRPIRQRSDPGVQVQIRLDGHQVAWLDQQVERLGAPSRSALVAGLLRAHLGAP